MVQYSEFLDLVMGVTADISTDMGVPSLVYCIGSGYADAQGGESSYLADPRGGVAVKVESSAWAPSTL